VGDVDFKMISATKNWNVLEILILKWFFSIKNSNKFQKIRLCKEKLVEDMVTLECLPFNSSRRNCDVPLVLLEMSRWFKFNGI
jgi:hypothetical protein